jgi:hypothetical protein
MKTAIVSSVAFALLSLVALTGCGPQAENAPPPSTVTSQPKSESSNADMAAMKEELAKLSPEDAASAEKQHTCPVTKKMLGTMGPPLKVDVKGKTVWICCEGCREELLANADKYLADGK